MLEFEYKQNRNVNVRYLVNVLFVERKTNENEQKTGAADVAPGRFAGSRMTVPCRAPSS